MPFRGLNASKLKPVSERLGLRWMKRCKLLVLSCFADLGGVLRGAAEGGLGEKLATHPVSATES